MGIWIFKQKSYKQTGCRDAVCQLIFKHNGASKIENSFHQQTNLFLFKLHMRNPLKMLGSRVPDSGLREATSAERTGAFPRTSVRPQSSQLAHERWVRAPAPQVNEKRTSGHATLRCASHSDGNN